MEWQKEKGVKCSGTVMEAWMPDGKPAFTSCYKIAYGFHLPERRARMIVLMKKPAKGYERLSCRSLIHDSSDEADEAKAKGGSL